MSSLYAVALAPLTEISFLASGTSGSEANFGGYKEIVLDNLVIERVDEDINKETLQGLIDKAEGLERTDYDKDAWKVLADAVVNAKVAVNKDKTDAHDIQTAYYEMKATLDYMEGQDRKSVV